MTTWKQRLDQSRLDGLLLSVHCHPWAKLSTLLGLSGLSEHAARGVALPLALRQQLVEQIELPSARRAEPRLGLTVRGTLALRQVYSRPRLRDAFLRAFHLDGARSLLAGWGARVAWSMSPFTVPARDVRPPRRWAPAVRDDRPREPGPGLYRSIRLDALACIRLTTGYAHLALLVDPGGLSLDWFFQQFRSLHAWHRQDAFWPRDERFPIVAAVAPTEARRRGLLEAWGEAAKVARGDANPVPLRLTTWDQLRELNSRERWLDEHGSLANDPTEHYGLFRERSLAPAFNGQPWWGQGVPDGAAFVCHPAPAPAPRGSFLASLRAPVRKNGRLGPVLRAHAAVSERGRRLLPYIGQYPLITTAELGVVLGRTDRSMRTGLRELRALGLTAPPAPGEAGYVLTARGLALLAAQAGLGPGEYARLRRWPTRRQGREVVFSVQGLLACRAHTRLVLDFLVGLRRHGPRAGVALEQWEHVDCLHEYPFVAPGGAAARTHSTPESWYGRITPDATGVVCVYAADGGRSALTEFWLEVDRGTERGRALLNKLNRYCQHWARLPAWRAARQRLLIVVEHGAEKRLRHLLQRLIELSLLRRAVLDVRLTRADLLSDHRGGLDPTRSVWRTLTDPGHVPAFNQPARAGESDASA